MNKKLKRSYVLLAFMFFVLTSINVVSQNVMHNKSEKEQETVKIVSANKIDDTTIELKLSDQHKMLVDFYGNNIFRLFQDNSGKGMRDPFSNPHAEILVKNPKREVSKLTVNDTGSKIVINTKNIELTFDKNKTTFELKNTLTNKVVVKSISPIVFNRNNVKIVLNENKDEYFYGGGVQNGRFSHKGKKIAIENQNSWTDGGVASPTPYYWSTSGYGFMWYTFNKGTYDFGYKNKEEVILTHDTDYLDVFFMVNDGPVALLNDFYQLTGNPVLIPEFGFYQGHLNAYNRDYWKEDKDGILFEDGKRYKESQKDNGGIKESLNGEKNNYQFSARAVIDRYANNDMPLGWILPNDGYGAGYGQTSTLDGNIENLKEFGDYARKKGVEIGLWTQSDLHPIDSIDALLQRDILKEVGVAGVRVLKTDVAWVGAGYSFGLNGIADAAQIMIDHGDNARPFIITLDGWAGTQRYATIWTGDQTGGKWEYIRFHIPTYIGSGLSGQPNICSDMDGIFGGQNSIVNTRDFQWKTFTLMQLNMDGWGRNEKYPHALGEPATSINRNYLKLKSELLPYAYSLAAEAVDGMPVIRAMFLEESNPYTLGKSTEYQFMFGPNFLVAPIYENTNSDELGNDIRNNIYLPKGEWVDYFSGDIYTGGKIINNFEAPIWKLPVFVKRGAIIPMAIPTNNVYEIKKDLRIYEIYPYGSSSFTEYEDDGKTTDYIKGKYATTKINSVLDKDKVNINIELAKGDFNGFVKEKETEFRINVSSEPKRVRAKINGKRIKLRSVESLADFNSKTNVYFYNPTPDMNRFATKGSEFEKERIVKNPQLFVKIEKMDVTKNSLQLNLSGYRFDKLNSLKNKTGDLQSISNITVVDSNATAYTLKPTWDKIENADFYEFEFDGMLYTNISRTEFLFENLIPENEYSFKVRAVNKTGNSDWVSFNAKTKSNPLQFAVKGIVAECSTEMYGGYGLDNLFDFDDNSLMHTRSAEKSLPFEAVLDLKSINHVEKIVYTPRESGLNGVIQSGKFMYSTDKEHWVDAGSFDWKVDNATKVFLLKDKPVARYIKFIVDKAYGNFVSGRELYVFKEPGTETLIPGDINSDGVIDDNDLVSYMNYTGLRKGDSDFDYVSRGDVNKNDLIDAYDISNVATLLDDGIRLTRQDKIAGKMTIKSSKTSYKAGEEVEVMIYGKDLKSVNAFSFALPYNGNVLEYVGVDPISTKGMENMTYNRLHSNGDRVLYPTFVNIGDQAAVEGDGVILTIKFKAKKAFKFNMKLHNGLLVDKYLNSIKF